MANLRPHWTKLSLACLTSWWFTLNKLRNMFQNGCAHVQMKLIEVAPMNALFFIGPLPALEMACNQAPLTRNWQCGMWHTLWNGKKQWMWHNFLKLELLEERLKRRVDDFYSECKSSAWSIYYRNVIAEVDRGILHFLQPIVWRLNSSWTDWESRSYEHCSPSTGMWGKKAYQ